MTQTMTHQRTNDRAARRPFITPRVDVVETSGAVVLVADVPGVAHEDLNINLDQDVLTIRGQVGAGVGVANSSEMYRQFKLSEQIDRDHIEAELKHGVLRLTLPKAEAAKARRIDVNVA